MSDRYMLAPNGRVHWEDEDCPRHSCVAVVVISPEDRAQVERLRDVTRNFLAEWEADLTSGSDLASAMQAALRTFLAPEKPAEPQGLGAVVEDNNGRLWVKANTGTHGFAGLPWRHKAESRPWQTITAVTVLSEGVTL